MSKVKGLIKKLGIMRYSGENQEKLKGLLGNIFDYQINQANELNNLCQKIESFYPDCFDESNPEFKKINEELSDFEKGYVHKFLQTYGETKEYDAKEIVFEAIDDIVYQHTYTGNMFSRDLLELQQIFGIKFDGVKNKKEVSSILKKSYGNFETNMGEEKVSALVYALAGPAVDYSTQKYLQNLMLLKKTLMKRRLFWDSELTFKKDLLKSYDKHRIKFQEILVRELYKSINTETE